MQLTPARVIVATMFTATLTCGCEKPAGPSLRIISPPEVVEAGEEVVLIAEYAGGVPSTFTASVNGIELEHLCYTGAVRVKCVPISPWPGTHRLVISIADAEGRRTEATMVFVRRAVDPEQDVNPPLLSFGVPDRGDVIRGAALEITVGYMDDHAGIDLERLTLRLDGVDILDRCQPPNGFSLECDLDGLEIGKHLLEASIADLAGNVSEEAVPFSRWQPEP